MWWEGLTDEEPPELMDWLRRRLDARCRKPPRTRTAASPRRSRKCPSIAPEWEDPDGVPISAILFGGRRATRRPAGDRGVQLAARRVPRLDHGSETTAAAAGKVGNLRRDPFAMLPFCGYHMGDYFAHWLKIGASTEPENLPRLFYVNWFRKGADGKFLWPGYGENSRVLEWVFERVRRRRRRRDADRPRSRSWCVPLDGLDIAPGALDELLEVDADSWRTELPLIEEHYEQFGERLPQTLRDELDALGKRLAE